MNELRQTGGFSLQEQDRVAVLTFLRVEKRNALELEDWRGLAETFRYLARESDLQALVLCGKGDTFCAGADISQFRQVRWERSDIADFQEAVNAALEGLAGLPLPTIARIEGACTGGGLELASFCDVRIAAQDSVLGLPVARLASPLGWRELQRLVTLVGVGWAAELLLTGRLLRAPEALALGLVTRVVPGADLEVEVQHCLEQIRSGAGAVHRIHKVMLRQLDRQPTLGGLGQDEGMYPVWEMDLDSYHEGVQAFLEKRQPRFQSGEPPQ